LRTCAAENVLPVIGAKRSSIFPLCITYPIAFANGYPAPFAYRNARTLVSFLEPGNDLRRFRAMPTGGFVVVRQRAVKRILSRRESYRGVVLPVGRIRIIKATVTF